MSGSILDQKYSDNLRRQQVELFETMANYSRLFCLFALFEISIFTACTSRLRSGVNDAVSPSAAKRSAGKFYELANSTYWQRAFANYSTIIISLYVYYLVSSAVTNLLYLDVFASYRYIDCYWLGRITILGRGSLGAKFLVMQLSLTILLLRLKSTFGGTSLYLQYLHFLHKDLAEVELCNNGQDLTRHKMHKPLGDQYNKLTGNGESGPDDGDGYDIYYKRFEPMPRFGGGGGNLSVTKRNLVKFLACNGNIDRQQTLATVDYDPVIFTKLACPAGVFVVLKLNRSSRNWKNVNVAVWAGWTCMVAIVAAWLASVLYMMTPCIVTERGFVLNHLNCIDYIQKYAGSNQSRAREFAFIYQDSGQELTKIVSGGLFVHKNAPFQLPMEDFVSGPYHLLRIALDYILSLIFLTDAAAFILSHFILRIPLYYDVIVNANELYKRLIRLRSIKWEQQAMGQLGRRHDKSAIGRTFIVREQTCPVDLTFKSTVQQLSSSFNARHPSYNTTIETLLLQALLLDHLEALKKYNDYLSLYSSTIGTIWLCFTLTFLMWLGFGGSRSVYQEFYFAEILASLACMGFLILVSITTKINDKFYPLITSLMALDDAKSITKERWTSIINYYCPKQMYCSTIASDKINFLFVIKMFSWTISALCVVVSFFTLVAIPERDLVLAFGCINGLS